MDQKLDQLELVTEIIADTAKIHQSVVDLSNKLKNLFECLHANLVYLLNKEYQAGISCGCSTFVACDRDEWNRKLDAPQREEKLVLLGGLINSKPFQNVSEALATFSKVSSHAFLTGGTLGG